MTGAMGPTGRNEPAGPSEPGAAGEVSAHRLDQNYAELLQEARVLQAGVQILFGFLLSLSFQQRFKELTAFQRDVYIGCLLAAVLSAGFILALVPFHRLVFRRGMKDELVRAAQLFLLTGIACLFVALMGAVLLVLDFVASRPFAMAATAVLTVVFTGLWYGAPVRERWLDRRKRP
jgi:membrane-associated HD superfamily phosphohydrolase